MRDSSRARCSRPCRAQVALTVFGGARGVEPLGRRRSHPSWMGGRLGLRGRDEVGRCNPESRLVRYDLRMRLTIRGSLRFN